MTSARPIMLAAFLSSLAAGAAFAQLPQPRCGGWPPDRPFGRQESILIVIPGSTCYGQLFNRVGRNTALGDIVVRQPPAQGRFQMIGHREFAYTAPAGFRGWDRVVLGVEGSGRSGPRRGRVVMRTTTADNYRASGLDPMRPPITTGLRGGGGGGRGRRGGGGGR